MAKKNDNSKLVAILSYLLIGIIWYFVDDKIKKDAFAKFHVKQALNLFIILICLKVLLELFILYSLISILNFVIFILLLIGLITALQGKKKEVPLVGQWAENYLNF